MKAKIFINLIIALVVLFASFGVMPHEQSPAKAATIVRVKPGGSTSASCGSSWANACELQTALTSAITGDEIWAAAGTYKPGSNREDTFQLISGVALYGGFAGTETAREQRDWGTNTTVLSGDIGVTDDDSDNSYHVVSCGGVDATTVLDGFTITGGNAPSISWPSYYTYGGGMYNFGSLTLANVTFDGNQAVNGGGMYNSENSRPTLTNVTYSNNQASTQGGGMFNEYSSPVLTNVTFKNNEAVYGGGMHNWYSSLVLTNVIFEGNSANNVGGGMHNEYSDPTLTKVTFIGNFAEYSGGGVFNLVSNPVMNNVIFSANTAGDGGGMCNNGGNPYLNNVTFSGNTARDWRGGGMYNGGNPTLTNVTFTNNKARSGGGMYNGDGVQVLTNVTFNGNVATENGGGMLNSYLSNPILTNVTFGGNSAEFFGGGMYNDASNPIITNAILWGNTASGNDSQIFNNASTSALSYSDVQGGCAAITGNDCSGEGNIDADPLFVRNPHPGPDGTWGTVDDDYGDLRLQIGSPAIDAGDNTAPGLVGVTTDLDGNPRFYDVPEIADTGVGPPPVVDMGAYEAVNIGPLEVYLPVIVR